MSELVFGLLFAFGAKVRFEPTLAEPFTTCVYKNENIRSWVLERNVKFVIVPRHPGNS